LLLKESAWLADGQALGDLSESKKAPDDTREYRLRKNSLGRRSGGKDGDEQTRGKWKAQPEEATERGVDPSLRFIRLDDHRGVRPLYRTLAPTKEWAENNYRHLRMAVQDANLVGPGRFWLD
jgi:hypothetical protein